MIARLSRLLGLTHWLMMEIQQKLLNIYNSEVNQKIYKMNFKLILFRLNAAAAL